MTWCPLPWLQVWGVLTWRGQREDKAREVHGRSKRLWRWVPTEQQAALLKPLVQELRQLKRWQKLATEGSSSSSSSSSTADS
jgi:hypothetical protein